MTVEELRQWRGVKPVAAPAGVAISTRLRTTGEDERVLDRVAEHLGRLRRADLARVVRPLPLGRALGGAATRQARRDRLNTRKAALTAQSSARWANAIIAGQPLPRHRPTTANHVSSGTLAFVSDSDTADSGEDAYRADEHRPVFSGFGIASAVLGLICVAAIVLTTLIWSAHRKSEDDLAYKARVLQVATSWAGVLINMNKDNVDSSVHKLHDGTVGELNTELDKAIEPYTSLVKTLQAKTKGQINSVSIESAYHDLDRQPGSPPPHDPMPGGLASRTDTVLVIATSVSENAGGKPQTVFWNLRIGVSNVGGELLVSHLDFLR
jgi:hypothetical protein